MVWSFSRLARGGWSVVATSFSDFTPFTVWKETVFLVGDSKQALMWHQSKPRKQGLYNTLSGRTQLELNGRYFVSWLCTRRFWGKLQHDVEPLKPMKLSWYISRFGNPRCSHVWKEKRVIEAPVSITAFRGTSLVKRGKCVVTTLVHLPTNSYGFDITVFF